VFPLTPPGQRTYHPSRDSFLREYSRWATSFLAGWPSVNGTPSPLTFCFLSIEQECRASFTVWTFCGDFSEGQVSPLDPSFLHESTSSPPYPRPSWNQVLRILPWEDRRGLTSLLWTIPLPLRGNLLCFPYTQGDLPSISLPPSRKVSSSIPPASHRCSFLFLPIIPSAL